jgi:hypothetical protein
MNADEHRDLRKLLELLENDRLSVRIHTHAQSSLVRGTIENGLTVLGADLADVIWSGCSSIAHGDLSGTLGILDKQIVARDKGVAYARVTGSISGLYWTTAGAVRMIEQGFNLYRHRAAGHY